MDYVVTCLTDDGERVRVTRKVFTEEEADHYMKGVAQSRKPEKHTLCSFCKVEWRTYEPTIEKDGYSDWPRCINCQAC